MKEILVRVTSISPSGEYREYVVCTTSELEAPEQRIYISNRHRCKMEKLIRTYSHRSGHENSNVLGNVCTVHFSVLGCWIVIGGW